MGAVNVLRELQAEGVQFTLVGDAVTWSGGAGHMTAERLAALKEGKAEVLQFLKTYPKKETSRRREKMKTEFSERTENPDAPEFSRRREKPDADAFEERAAICEFDGGLTRADAEQVAAECQGFSNVIEFKAAQQRRASDG